VTFHQVSKVLVSGTQVTVDTLIWVLVVLGPIAVFVLLMLLGVRLARKKPKKAG
jgi:hypothetical protein